MEAIHVSVGTARNGFTSYDIAETCYAVWSNLTGITIPWQSADRQTWDRVATTAILMVDDWIETEVSISFSNFARSLFCLAYGPEAIQKWDTISPQHKLVWEAVGRHIINCLDAEAAAVQTKHLEEQVINWFHQRKGE